MSEKADPQAPVEPTKPKPLPRKEFRHPVLQMMGIPRLRVPSRNWLIFWSVTGSLCGLYYWDRRERLKVRDYWISRVSHLGEEPIQPYDLSRKITVYAAPPPNDFIDATLKHFRNFIKPVLTSAAVDHELITEERQGYIRSKVAEEIRQLRRNIAEGKTGGSTDEMEAKIVSKWNRDTTGGTIIVGRGAYKEYMAGVQEGWFGPLERPQHVQEELDRQAEEERERLKKRHEEKAAATDGANQFDYNDEQEYEQDKKATLHHKYPVVPAYVKLPELAECELPAEYAAHVPEPISVFRLPHLLGILMTPVRIYRWLNQRHLAEEMGRQAVGVVLAQTRQFTEEDAQLAVSDEEDWPNRFKSNGMDNNSEWMREFVVDPRIAASMHVYKEAERSNSAQESS